MNQSEAFCILGITSQDDLRSAKIKYRKLMRRFHPDSTAGEDPGQILRAQEINLAYELVKESLENNTADANILTLKQYAWDGEQNANAYTERNIYQPYQMNVTHLTKDPLSSQEPMYQHIARGKYYWDPLEEEFLYFMKSIHHAAGDLLRELEGNLNSMDNEELESLRFPYQLSLVYLIGQQYVPPVRCLHLLADPVESDESGREIYQFRAFVSSRKRDEKCQNITALHAGDRIYADSLSNQRIQVSDAHNRTLGELSFEDDELYFCLIPLLKAHKASVKMHVKSVTRAKRPLTAHAEIQFSFRLEILDETYEIPGISDRIQLLLKKYTDALHHFLNKK